MGKKSFKIKIKVKEIKNGLTMGNKETICEKRDCLNIGTELLNNRLFCKEHKNIMSNNETNKTADKILAIIQKNYNFFRGTNEAELHSSVEISELFVSQNQANLKRIEDQDAEIQKLREALESFKLTFKCIEDCYDLGIAKRELIKNSIALINSLTK